MNMFKSLLACLLCAITMSGVTVKAGDDSSSREKYLVALVGTTLAIDTVGGTALYAILDSNAPGWLQTGASLGMLSSGILANIILIKEAILAGMMRGNK